MRLLDKVMELSTPNVETGCRVWTGHTNLEGEPKLRIKGKWLPVKTYLTAKKHKREGYWPTFENTCGNRRCVTVTHLRIVDWIPR